jgi:hypothetical protein
MTVDIHQLVHGYRRGHQLLSSSVRLPSKSSDLTKRLSDLSGLLTREPEFTPYLTTYPLPDGDFHALARTWPDLNASRAGCVLTHTLLIPTDYWATATDHRTFFELFRLPEEDLESYSFPLRHEESYSAGDFHDPVISSGASQFVSKYFGQGLRPVVWFDENCAEEILWQILNAIWPALRRRFACCTFSLQPRQTDEQPFDLLFAPSYVYSRFNKIAKQNLLDPSQPAESDHDEDSEPWIRDFTGYIFGRQLPSLEGAMKELGPLLGDNPTSIRNLFRLEELRRRTESSPTAAIGLMDVVSSLAPEARVAIDYKRKVVDLAINSAKHAEETSDSLKSLYLVSERLEHPSYRSIQPMVAVKLSEEIRTMASRMPEIAIAIGERLFSPSRADFDSIYRQGLIRGLSSLSNDAPERLAVLHRFPLAAAMILAAAPEVGKGYLKGLRAMHDAETAISDLAVWVTSISDGQIRENLRGALLPGLHGDDDGVLVEALLTDIRQDEVAAILNILFEGTNGFASDSLLRTLMERVAMAQPGETRKWATQTKLWSDGAAALIAASYSKDPKGVNELLSLKFQDHNRLADITISYLQSISAPAFPLWFREHARNHAAFLVPILLYGQPSSIEILLENLFSQIKDVPIAREYVLKDKVADFVPTRIGPLLADQAMRSAISGFVSGEIDWADYECWQSLQWAQEWLSASTSWELESLLVPLCRDYSSWSRAWNWLGKMPKLLVSNISVPARLVESLISVRRFEWPWEDRDTVIWTAILERASHRSEESNYLQLCAFALDFAFRNCRFPVSDIVIHSFWPVYSELVKVDTPGPLSNIIFTVLSLVDLDWDKAKDLRKKLVHSYMSSSWRPRDLALAIKDRDTLRKIFKRILKRHGGSRYIASMIEDLRTQKDDTATATADYLAELQASPYFYEPWD